MSQKSMRKELKPMRGVQSNVPDVRSEVVARGRLLILDPNYPSKEDMKKIATLLVAHWSGDERSLRNGSVPREDRHRDGFGDRLTLAAS